MAWTVAEGSSIFRAWMEFALAPQPGWGGGWGAVGVPADPANDGRFKVAIFDDTPTPDKSALAAVARYNTGEWAAGEVDDTGPDGNWPAGGTDLLNVTYADVGQAVVFTADPTGGPTIGVVTIDGAAGDQLYFTDASGIAAGGAPLLPDQGSGFHSFGGPQSVTAGFFTVRWSTLGIMLVTI